MKFTSGCAAPKSYTSIVIGTYNGHLHPQQLEMVKALAQNSGKPVTVVALRNPYDLFPLPETIYTLAAYEYTARSMPPWRMFCWAAMPQQAACPLPRRNRRPNDALLCWH